MKSEQQEMKQETKLRNLREWTGLSNYFILYDSDEMPFDRRSFQRVIYGRNNVMGLVITSSGEVFGSFHPTTLPQEDNDNEWVNDNNYFVFKINNEVCKYSKHERINTDWSLYLWSEHDSSLPNFYCVLFAFGLSFPLNNERSGIIRRGFECCYKSNQMLADGTYDNYNNVLFKPSRLILLQWFDN
ncbi:hypothetical protein ENUP19_0121G0125 [Entamoeba nuttalli]|uniref:TLDc domain-containing protein n=2 Tax=Entamoeba nuttalli TaxID=412467 RepID=K2GW36_ENTNP|nr:hypothetical protein ENU1_129390 [Entamoeba nuttalli P19]EKE39408.1 hypothetical protein ENU1_129390 [Entamoeba nuttalli P19]|eukprot:XP_008858256.1 hypothetical protein ENU1_129390 [Entamoeba nuttalli P19]